jgi:hypothetical protein
MKSKNSNVRRLATIGAVAILTGCFVGVALLSAPHAAVAAFDEPPPVDTMDGPLPDDPPPDKTGLAPEPRKLTEEEVNRIRYMELRAMRGLRGVDRVTVKVPRDTANDFLVEMTGHDDFKGKRAKKNFLKQTPPQKLHTIAVYQGASYVDRVKILTDPEIFLQFRKHVMPQVIRGCATSGCHVSTNEKAYGFKLFNDPKLTPETTYANFITLNDITLSGDRMIDRNAPENSLMATYMLPHDEVPVEYRHPGNIEYRPLFQSARHPRYRRILSWIGSLKIPQEDYGVRLIPLKEIRDPTTRPADDDDDNAGDDNQNGNAGG